MKKPQMIQKTEVKNIIELKIKDCIQNSDDKETNRKLRNIAKTLLASIAKLEVF